MFYTKIYTENCLCICNKCTLYQKLFTLNKHVLELEVNLYVCAVQSEGYFRRKTIQTNHNAYNM